MVTLIHSKISNYLRIIIRMRYISTGHYGNSNPPIDDNMTDGIVLIVATRSWW